MPVNEAAERLRTQLKSGKTFVFGNQFEHDAVILAAAYLAENDPTPIDEAWLRSIGFREWTGDEEFREFDLYIPMRDEIGWECRLAYQSNGLYAVRMCDREDVGRELWAESVELLGTRNKTPSITRGDVLRLMAALGIPGKVEDGK
jgi:hypothetical protein